MGVFANIRRALADFGKPSFAGTPFPNGVVDQQDQLKQELGGTGTFNFGGFIRGEDFNPQMDAQTAIKNLDEMRRSDAQAHAALEVVKMPIRTADYEIDPGDPEDPESQRQAEFIRYCLFEAMTTTWDDLIRQSLLMLDFGFMLFEKVWTIEEAGVWANHIVLKRLAPRPPKTLWQWFTDEDGALLSIKQLAVKAGTYQFLDIPASKLVRFTFQQEGDNFQGISMLRTAYPHWLIKKQLYVIDAIRATRFGVGIPRAKLLPGYKPTTEDRSAIAMMLQGLSSHQHAYLIEPPQVAIDILMPQGVQGGAQLLPSINHQNEQITRNILAQFLDMGGKSQGGSHALGSSAMDFFLNAIESIAEQICDVINKQVIKDLIDMNFEPRGGKYPTLRPMGIHETDVKSMAAAAASLATAGFLTPDKKTENTFRNLLNLPEVPDEDDLLMPDANGNLPQPPPQQPGAPAPGAPQAPPPTAPPATPATAKHTPAKPATAKHHPATGGTTAHVPAAPVTTADVPAAPATGQQVPAAPATGQQVPAAPATNQPGTAAPATQEQHEAVLRPGLQAPTVDAAEPDVAPPPDYTKSAGANVSGRPAVIEPNSQPPVAHDPRTDARTTVYQNSPASTTVQTPHPAVSNVRDTVPAQTTVSTTVPASAHMARNSTASSGQSDESEGHTSNVTAKPVTSLPHGAAPATAQPMTAIPASEILSRTPQIALASKSRQKSDRQPDRWTMEDGLTSLWRQPTPLETQVLDLHETPRRLDIARSALRATLQAVREEQILRIAEAVAHASKVSDLKAPLVGKMTSDIQKAMQDVFTYGFNKVKDELHKQKAMGARRFADGETFSPLNSYIKVNTILAALGPLGTEDQIHNALVLLDEHMVYLANIDESQNNTSLQKIEELYDKIDTIKTKWELAKHVYNKLDHDAAIRDIKDRLLSAAKGVDTARDAITYAATSVSGSVKSKAIKQLVASAEVSAQTQADKLLANAKGESLRLKRAGWEPDEISDALKIHMGELSDADINRIAAQETNEAFSLGRAAAAAEFKDQIQKVVYSAILDNNCCPVCEDLDGEEFDIDSDEYEEHMPPNANCEGGDACRCTYIYVLDPEPVDSTTDAKDEAKEDDGTGLHELYEGQPRAEKGLFGTGRMDPQLGTRGLPKMFDNIAKPDGGFTYHAVTGDQPKTGYALSIYKGRERVLDAKTMTPVDLVKFAADNHDVLRQPDNYFGAWHNPQDGKVYLDVSKVVHSAKEAESVGRTHHQLAYFDLAGGKSVEISGLKHSERVVAVVREHGKNKTTTPHHGAEDRRTIASGLIGVVRIADRAEADSDGTRGRGKGIQQVGLGDWNEDAHPRDGHGRFGAGAAGPKGEKDDHVPDSVKDTMFAKGLDASQWHDHAVKMVHDLDAAHADDPTWNQNVASVQAAMANFPMIHTAQLGNIEDIAKVGLEPASDFHAGLTFDKISGLDRTVFMRMGQAGGGGHGAVGVMVDPTKLDTSNFIVTKLGAMTLKQDEEAFLKTPGDHSALVASQLSPYRDSTISYKDLPAVQSRLLVNGYEKDNPGTRGTVISPEKIVANDHGEMEVKFAGKIPPEALVGFFAGDQKLSQFDNKSAYDYLKGKVPDAKLIKYSGEGLHQLSTAYRAYYAPGQKHRERLYAVVRMDDGEDFESAHPRGHGGKFMTKEQKVEAATERDAATPHVTFNSPIPPVPANFTSLSQADRDKYTDAAHTIPARIEELTAGHEWPRTDNVQADITARLDQFKDRLAPEAQRMIQGDVHEFARQLDAVAGQNEPEAYRTLVEKYTDVAVANSVEAASHVLSDHGEHHGLGNAEMANNILSAKGSLTQLDRVENSILGTFHDAGYMTPAGRQFTTGEHPRNGMQYYDAHVRDAVAALIGDQRANEISRIIGTHQDTTMDWKGDPRAAAFRLADNLAVFSQEKAPPLFRYVPENKDVMDRWSAGKMTTADAQKAISDNVHMSTLPPALKDQLQRAAGEVKDSLPKFIGGMWSGTVDNISWSAHDRSPVISVLNTGNDALKERLDMGQRQFDKLAETFGRSSKEFATSPTMQLKDGKRVVATIKVHGKTIKAS